MYRDLREIYWVHGAESFQVLPPLPFPPLPDLISHTKEVESENSGRFKMSRLDHVLRVGAAIQQVAVEPTRMMSSNDDSWMYEDNTNTAVGLAIWQWWNTSLKYSDIKGGRDPKRAIWHKSLHEGITDWESLGKAWSAVKELLEKEGFTSEENKKDMEETFALLKPMILHNLKETVEYKAIMAEHVEHHEKKAPGDLNPYFWLYEKLPEDYDVFTKDKGDEIAEWLMKFKIPDDGLDFAAEQIARARNTVIWRVKNRLYAIRDRLKAISDSQPRAEYRQPRAEYR